MKKWSTIDAVIDNFANGNNLELVVEETTVFTNEQVYNVLADLFSSFSFLHRETEEAVNAFTRQYNTYRGMVGENYYRMYDALTRKYNPINNYEMVESGVDGHKVSKHITNTNDNKFAGDANATVSTVETPYSKTTEKVSSGKTKTSQDGSQVETDAGDETRDSYVNAFDSGISDTGTHTNREVISYGDKTKTTSFNGRSETIEYGADGAPMKETVTESTNADITTETQYSNLSETFSVKDYETGSSTSVDGSKYHHGYSELSGGRSSEEYGNDVSLSFSKETPDGSTSNIPVGNDFSDGTVHAFTRSGNIGVTTSAQMIQGELEVRKVQLLTQYVEGFINLYCTIKDEWG